MKRMLAHLLLRKLECAQAACTLAINLVPLTVKNCARGLLDVSFL